MKTMSIREAKRNRIYAETKRLSALGFTAGEIAIELKVKRNLILRIRDQIAGTMNN